MSNTNAAKKKVWGWMMFDWASQPYATLLLTFIFGPYFAEIVTDSLVSQGMLLDNAQAKAQSYWGYGLAATGLLIALLAPILGAIADGSGRRIPWIIFFSVLYVVGSAGLWYSNPDDFSITQVLFFFGLGLIGMEFATIFTNALLPMLGPRSELGRISGSGWALGYTGGVLALALTILFLADNKSGLTLLGNAPAFGLDSATREGTRFVGPLAAIWYAVFMIPFFLWVRDPFGDMPLKQVISEVPALGRTFRTRLKDVKQTIWPRLGELKVTLKNLPNDTSLLAYLGSSMFYRDALNGFYAFGGIYAVGVLGWTVTDVGVFGIVAAISGAIFALLGGYADRYFGPKPVIATCIIILLAVCIVIISISRESVLWIPISQGSPMPDITFYITGALIGGAGGALQAASRTMMVHQANPKRLTEAFGIYALAGKATSFIAPFSIAVMTDITDNQSLGITPLVVLFLLGLILLFWVESDKERAVKWSKTS